MNIWIGVFNLQVFITHKRIILSKFQLILSHRLRHILIVWNSIFFLRIASIDIELMFLLLLHLSLLLLWRLFKLWLLVEAQLMLDPIQIIINLRLSTSDISRHIIRHLNVNLIILQLNLNLLLLVKLLFLWTNFLLLHNFLLLVLIKSLLLLTNYIIRLRRSSWPFF